jgi:F0F1-type ATP synthase membrane subunit b/b'
MHLSRLFHKTALLLILLMSFHTIVAPVASAVMVETATLVSAQEVDASRARLAALLAREDVGAALQSHGVSAQEVLNRVNSLTDQEVTKLAQNIDALPAGADGFGSLIGALVFIFLVLLFTDLLGLTDVYPFVKKH